MEVTLKYFGIIADIAQKKEEPIFIGQDSNTVKKLQSFIEVKYPKILVINYSIAVNEKFLQNDVELKNNDIIAFLPPFAGG
ncbi:MoaD/ThiS family protein [Flavobacterium sp.]|uniref:MoaD/ThiS family protein n=1 Tax=Flavobacterium sp. TaxID=239 RepID=UPI0025F5AE88|nr:MoaD/ThiS family protein [Flavobacterium sp.]